MFSQERSLAITLLSDKLLKLLLNYFGPQRQENDLDVLGETVRKTLQNSGGNLMSHPLTLSYSF